MAVIAVCAEIVAMAPVDRDVHPLHRVLAYLLVWGFAAAGGPQATAAEANAASDIRIGMVNAQTGPAAALGQGMLAGAQAVFKDVNSRGGVHGHKIVLRVADDAYEPDQTVEQTLKMVQDEDVLALFGFVGTPTTNAVLPLLGELKVPLVGVFSGAQSLRQPVMPQVFNVRASYNDETEALVERLLAGGAKKIAVVYQNDGFGIAVLAGTDRALKRRGLSVHSTGSFQRNTVAIRTALYTMVEQQPDAIVLAGPYVPVAAFVKQARSLGVTAQFASVSFVGTDSLLSRVEGHGQGMLISQVVPFPWDSDVAIARECRDALKRHADEPLGFVNFEGCISARLLVRALELAGPTPTRRSLADSLEAMDAADLGGLPVKLSAQNHQAMDRVFLTQIVDGKITKVR
jgi:branched-chain amino acid transport system substrate-binding protein